MLCMLAFFCLCCFYIIYSVHTAKNYSVIKMDWNSDKTEFVWHINNFEMCPDKWGKPLKSPDFGIYNWQGPKFHLLLYPGGVNENSSQFISVYLVKTSFDEDFSCSCAIGILTTKNKEECYNIRKCELNKGNGKGSAQFFLRKKLQTSEKDVFLPDGNLTIYCELNAIKVTESLSYSTRSQLKDLSDIYSIIFKSEKYCDLYLHVGEKTFKVHRAILEARFPSLIKNTDGNKCKVEGISSTNMNTLLHYVYTGIINIGDLNLFEILSSNYELPSHLKYLFLEKQNKVEVTTSFQKTLISFSWNIKSFSSLASGKSMHYALIGDYDVKSTWLDLFLTQSADGKNITICIKRFSKECKRIICTIKASNVSKTFDHTYGLEDKWVLPNFLLKDILHKTASDAALLTVSDAAYPTASHAASDSTSEAVSDEDLDSNSDATSDADSDVSSNESSDKASDEINLVFEIAVSSGSNEVELRKKDLVFKSDSVNKTAEDLKSFHKDVISIMNIKKFSDVTLIAEKNKIPAHKFILSSRSSVFYEILENETTKKNTEIHIDNFDADVIKDMLYYMYCNEVKFSVSGFKHIRNMHNAACKYNLPELKKECMNVLKPNINAETAGEILIFADQYKNEELKEIVYNYVCTHPKQIANSKNWEEVIIKRSDLAAEVLKRTLLHLASK